MGGNLERVAFYLSVVAAGLGAVALFSIWFRWSWLGRHYREFWAKSAVAAFRAIAALSAVAAKAAPADPDKGLWEQPWVATVLIAAVGYLFWEVAGVFGDYKHKFAKEKAAEDHKNEIDRLMQAHRVELEAAAVRADVAEQDREDAVFEALRHGWLLSHLRSLVSEKRRRVRRVTEELGGGRPTIQHARDGLAPAEQVHFLLEFLASLLRLHATHADDGRYKQNFRIGLYAERDGRLEPLDAFDLTTRQHDPFSSYAEHTDRYRLDNVTNPSHAVRCVREGRTLIVADCEADPEFEFFHERQRNYLRSMIARPLQGFCLDGVNPVRAALLIDTDAADFFREDDREMLELLLGEFVARIDLEYAISGLTGVLVA